MTAVDPYETSCAALIMAASDMAEAARIRDMYARMTVSDLTDGAPMRTVRMWARLSTLANKRYDVLVRASGERSGT